MELMITYAFIAIISFFTGFGLAWVFLRKNVPSTQTDQGTHAKLNEAEASLMEVRRERDQLQGRLDASILKFNEQRDEMARLRHDLSEQTKALATATALESTTRKQLETRQQELSELNERFTKEFKLVADQLLKTNSQEFAVANQTKLNEIVTPFKERIEKFQELVTNLYNQESKDRSQLLGQVNQLMELNKSISQEAHNLTNALKGDTQKQGAWGELILDKVLESAGLESGVEFEKQESTTTEEGRFRPDVVVKLPEGKVIIIDSKVSLIAYERAVNAATDDERAAALKEHVASMKTHVKALSDKNYPGNHPNHALEYVLMFVPIEAGFVEALKFDTGLFDFAWQKRVVIVCPTTLLATLRAVASIWRMDKQNRNVAEIARLAQSLSTKFKGFNDDMQKIEKSLQAASGHYNNAVSKLSQGKGNAVSILDRMNRLNGQGSDSAPTLGESADELE